MDLCDGNMAAMLISYHLMQNFAFGKSHYKCRFMVSGVCCFVTVCIVLKFQRIIIPSSLRDSTPVVLLDTEDKGSVILK